MFLWRSLHTPLNVLLCSHSSVGICRFYQSADTVTEAHLGAATRSAGVACMPDSWIGYEVAPWVTAVCFAHTVRSLLVKSLSSLRRATKFSRRLETSRLPSPSGRSELIVPQGTNYTISYHPSAVPSLHWLNKQLLPPLFLQGSLHSQWKMNPPPTPPKQHNHIHDILDNFSELFCVLFFIIIIIIIIIITIIIVLTLK